MQFAVRAGNEFEIDAARPHPHLSKTCGNALVVLYDNRVGLRVSSSFAKDNWIANLVKLDEKWVPLDERGDPDMNHHTLSADELDSDDEYACTQDAIFLGLAKLGVANFVTSSDLKQTFAYDEGEVWPNEKPITEDCRRSPRSARSYPAIR